MPESTPGIEAWKEHASAFDRVQAIASAVSQPRPASFVADEAHFAENTAREHLEWLVDLNVLLKSDESGTTLYSPDPLHTRIQTLRDLLENHDRDGLIRLKSDLQSQIEDWRETYGVDSPSELRARAAGTETAAETDEIQTTANDWELVAYRLAVIEDAIENYATYDYDFRTSA